MGSKVCHPPSSISTESHFSLTSCHRISRHQYICLRSAFFRLLEQLLLSPWLILSHWLWVKKTTWFFHIERCNQGSPRLSFFFKPSHRGTRIILCLHWIGRTWMIESHTNLLECDRERERERERKRERLKKRGKNNWLKNPTVCQPRTSQTHMISTWRRPGRNVVFDKKVCCAEGEELVISHNDLPKTSLSWSCDGFHLAHDGT